MSSHSWRMRITNNSLFTMSSPVSTSSRSSSGSTPAPTVNTPASPPSQPVSLPENNTLAQAIFQELSWNRSLRCYLPFKIQVAGTQTWPQRLVLSPRPRHQRRLRHPPAPVLPALPLSLQVRLLCPHSFQPTAHLAVLRLSLLFSPHAPPSCL